MGHRVTCLLWLHFLASRLNAHSQYSSVSKTKVQVNLGTPRHRISLLKLLRINFIFAGGFSGFPLLEAPEGSVVPSAIRNSGTQEHPSPITVIFSPACPNGSIVVVGGGLVITVVAVGFGVVGGHVSVTFPTVYTLFFLFFSLVLIVQPSLVGMITGQFSKFFL